MSNNQKWFKNSSSKVEQFFQFWKALERRKDI